MNALRNILVLMEPGAESQPAFDAAMTLAKRYGSSLELLIGESHDSIMAGHRATLERYVSQAGEEGVGAIGEALSGTPFHEIVLARVAATRPDLVVKYSVFHNRVERTLFTGSDWHLIRDCPVPLLLVKEPARLVGARMLACVDPTHAHDKPAALDVQLLQRGAALANRLGGQLHAVHVFSVPAPVGVIGDAYIASAAMPPVEQSVEQARKACLDLATANGLPADRIHFRVGAPARDIVAQAREIDASLVLMGAVSRRRLERWFVGSTAEAVLDRLPCNVWVEKPGVPA